MGRLPIAKAAAVVLASLVLVSGPAFAAQQDPTAKTLECLRLYRAAIDDYRAKRSDAAIAALSGLDHEQLKLIARQLEMFRSSERRGSRETDALFAWDRQTLLAAGMLHVDAALQDAADFAFHALLAGDLLVLAEAPSRGNAPGSAQRRNALAAGLLLIYGGTVESYGYLMDATERFPDDAPLLTALGMASENQAAALLLPIATDKGSFDRSRGWRNDYLRDAASLFGRAIALAPALLEAKVRLARVKTLQHDDSRAAVLLEQVLAAQPPPRWKYLALLLLGGVRERAGRADEAIRLYEQAIDIRPDGQSAYLAMSHTMYAAGDREAAGKTLDRMFARALTPVADEPWWDYLSDWIAVQLVFQELREEAQR